jgi:hypothetical protein
MERNFLQCHFVHHTSHTDWSWFESEPSAETFSAKEWPQGMVERVLLFPPLQVIKGVSSIVNETCLRLKHIAQLIQ